jgi:hypothetical protein
MHSWRYAMGASILCLWAAAACSDDPTSAPAAPGDEAGAAQGGSAGMSPAGGSAGTTAGGSAGTTTGGSAGTTTGGSDSAGTPGAGEGGSGGIPVTGPFQAMLGQRCALGSTIGVVELTGFPTPYVQVSLFDGADPWIGEPELSTPSCDFYRYVPGGCPTCESGEVCSVAGDCVPERRTIKDATLRVTTGAEERLYTADPQLGGISSALDIGDASSTYAMTLSWGDTEVRLDAMSVASADLANVEVTTESQQYDMPGALDASWDPSDEGAFVRARIPINHHAGGPTFTECSMPESAGAFHADAAMINPLAVQTGLEFQGLEHVFIAAAMTPAGCVELRFGAQIQAPPN